MTAVDGYHPSKGELVYNVGTRMSVGDLAVKTGLSVQRLINLNAEVFGEEQLDADTILKPGDTIWFESEPESGEEADGSSARGAAGARAPPDRRGSLKGARRKRRAAADLGTALKAKSGRVQLMNLFQADNMSLDTRLKWMGERRFRLPKFQSPSALFAVLNTLINECPSLGDAEARRLQSDNNHRLAAMEAQLDFESLPSDVVATMTRRMQASLMYPESGDPVISAFKAELETAVKRQEKKERKAAQQPGAPCGQRMGANDVQGLARALISEMRRSRDEDSDGNGAGRRRPGFSKRRGWVGVGERLCYRCGEQGHMAPECPLRRGDDRADAKADGKAELDNGESEEEGGGTYRYICSAVAIH